MQMKMHASIDGLIVVDTRNYNLKSKYWLTSKHLWRGFVKRVLNRYAETGLIEKEFDNQTGAKKKKCNEYSKGKQY